MKQMIYFFFKHLNSVQVNGLPGIFNLFLLMIHSTGKDIGGGP